MTIIKPEELLTLISSYIIHIVDNLEEILIQVEKNKGKLKNIVDEKEILSIDGKVSRGSGRGKINGEEIPVLNTLSAYSSKYGINLGQEYIDKKNEVPNVPKLIQKLNIKGMILTWDALNTQKETVKEVIKGK